MNLKMPPEDNSGNLQQAWRDLLSGLFQQLQEALARGERPELFAQLKQDLLTWQPFIEHKAKNQDVLRGQWEAACRLLWCAAQAAANPSREADAIDRISLVFADNVPPFMRGHEGWALDCIRLLQGASPPLRSRRVSVALGETAGGHVATLVLEVLQPGGGQVFIHPEDTLRTYARDDFVEAMQAAWEAAKALIPREGDSLFDGRWRLLRPDNLPESEVSGPSAGGAAALGWYHALKGTFPDERVIVLARIDRAGRFGPVGEVKAKVGAIAEDGRFDTIVVVGGENQGQAEQELRSRNKLRVIRVVNLDDGNS